MIQEINLRGGQILQINCTNDRLIHLFSAFHGLYFNFNSDTNEACSDVCYSRNNYENVKALCQSKKECQMTYYSIEPCPNCWTYQNVKYICTNNSTINMLNQCKNIAPLPPEICPKSNDPSIKDQTWFYGYQTDGANISCTSLQKIQIKCAFYGWDTLNLRVNPVNDYGVSTAYYKSTKAFNIISNKCNNLTTCVIKNDIDTPVAVNRDPVSILQIQWTCFP